MICIIPEYLELKYVPLNTELHSMNLIRNTKTQRQYFPAFNQHKMSELI
jgi:hypothetical protein